MTSSSPPALPSRDPYSADHIASPPIASSKSVLATRSVRLGSPSIDRADVSSPSTQMSAHLLARKRQWSSESDEPELSAAKRQVIQSIMNQGNSSTARETITSTHSTESETVLVASQRLEKKRNSGFHDAREFQDSDDKEVANPALHADSGFYEPADDNGQDKDNATSRASTELGEQPARRILPSAPVADMAIGDDLNGSSIGDMGSIAVADSIDDDHIEESSTDENNIECGSIEEDPVEEEPAEEEPAEDANVKRGSPEEPTTDEADAEMPDAPRTEDDRAEASLSENNRAERGSSRETIADKPSSGSSRADESPADNDKIEREIAEEPAVDNSVEAASADGGSIECGAAKEPAVPDEAETDVVVETETKAVKADAETANKDLASSVEAAEDRVQTPVKSPKTTPTPTSQPRAAITATPARPERVVLASVLDQTPASAAAAHDHPTAAAKEFIVSHISAHRPAADGSDHLELRVHWAAGEPTWEAEDQVHLGARDAVAEYWAGVDGGRASMRPYEVFAVRGHEWVGPKGVVVSKPAAAAGTAKAKGKGKKGKAKSARLSLRLRVEWLGYVDETLEPVGRFSKDQPELVERYFEAIGGRPEHP